MRYTAPVTILELSMRKHPNHKASDEMILRLTFMGRSLQGIGRALGCHPTTISLRLVGLGVPPADTRRSFVDDILDPLPPSTTQWLEDTLYDQQQPIKDYLRDLIVKDHALQTHDQEPHPP